MVMFNLSLRAVFRKESWMFCAGLLLSIADLLWYFDLQQLAPWARDPSASSNQQHVPRSLPHQEHGGTTCLLAASFFPKGCAAQQVAARSIRRPPPLFNREVAEK